jgi:MYXO-CTERM domain-containing protein
VVVPSTQAAPPPIELEEVPYPNGFADPNAAYGNDMSVAVRQENDGFDWGLLGLLGLFGLFGLYRRRDGMRHTVHSEQRYEDGRPPLRRE